MVIATYHRVQIGLSSVERRIRAGFYCMDCCQRFTKRSYNCQTYVASYRQLCTDLRVFVCIQLVITVVSSQLYCVYVYTAKMNCMCITVLYMTPWCAIHFNFSVIITPWCHITVYGDHQYQLATYVHACNHVLNQPCTGLQHQSVMNSAELAGTLISEFITST